MSRRARSSSFGVCRVCRDRVRPEFMVNRVCQGCRSGDLAGKWLAASKSRRARLEAELIEGSEYGR